MLPTTFKLGGRTWRVILKSDKWMIKTAGQAAFGYCNYDAARIYIVKDLSEDMTGIAFEHELEHAIDYTRGVMDHDEIAVDGRANLRHQFNKTRKEKPA